MHRRRSRINGSTFLSFRNADSMPGRPKSAAESRVAIAALLPHAAKIVWRDRPEVRVSARSALGLLTELSYRLSVPRKFSTQNLLQKRGTLLYYAKSDICRAFHLGLTAPAAGQSVSPTRLRFISKKRTGSLPDTMRSPTSLHAPSLITAV